MLESRQVAWPAYLVSIAIIVLPLSDVATSLYPWRFLDPRWRFGAVGLVSSALLLPMAGLLIAFLTSATLQHRTTRRVIGIVSLLGALGCFLALLMFGLDALQTRATVRPEMQLSFNVASAAAGMKTLVAAITFLAIGIAAIRDRRGKAGDPKQVPLFKVSTAPVPSAK